MATKVGNFDWIADWPGLRRFLDDWIAAGKGDETTSSHSAGPLRALVIGCGTSPLSSNLGDLGVFGTIVSVDNDAECIRHMKQQNAGNALLQWYIYDMVERAAPNDAGSDAFAAEYQSFDLIVDKGTFDAILVGGVAYPMLCEVHRLLKADGCYMLCSIHPEGLLRHLFSSPCLGMDIVKMDVIGGSSEAEGGSAMSLESSLFDALVAPHAAPMGSTMGSTMGTMLLCKKTAFCAEVDEQALALHERDVMDQYYQQEKPLLTQEYMDRTRAAFELELRQLQRKVAWGSEGLPFDAAHRVLFLENEALGYTMEMFLGDLDSFPLAAEGQLSLQEMLNFVQEMQ